MNSVSFIVTPEFKRVAKRLSKKYPSLPDDLANLRDSLSENPYQGKELSHSFRKIRLKISSKGKGKSGGARVITLNWFHDEENKKIILVTLYDKNERQSISEYEINRALCFIDL